MSRQTLAVYPLCCALITVCVLACRPQEKSKPAAPADAYAQAKADAKCDGYPMSAEDLQRLMPPPERNAAPLYRKFQQLDNAKPLTKDESDALFAGSDPAEFSADKAERMRQALHDRKELLTLLHQAAALPQCGFPRDWSKDFIAFPDYALMRKAARWLSAESRLALYDGKWQEAIDTQALGFHLANQVASEPTEAAYLVAVAIDSLTVSGLRCILILNAQRPDVADAVQKAIEQNYKPLDLAYALRGELALQLLMLESLRKEDPKVALSDLFDKKPSPAQKEALHSIKTRADYDRFLDANAVNMISIGRKAAQAATLSYLEGGRILYHLNEQIPQNRQDYLIVNLLANLYTALVPNLGFMQAQTEVVRVGAAVLAWQARNHKAPTRLQEVMSSVPADPFDGKPLRYRQEGKGFCVYSVGPTLKFDGGAPESRPASSESVFRSPLPVPLQ